MNAALRKMRAGGGWNWLGIVSNGDFWY